MAIIVGITPSFKHSQNGMTLQDMQASLQVANLHDEVIIYRSTGPWAKRWIQRGYPTKNFHVKGKSSDWGPHAGLVPYNGKYSKVGFDEAAAKKGTKKNDHGLKSGFAGKQPLMLDDKQINEQLTVQEGDPAKTAITSKFPVQNSKDFILVANRSGDQKEFAFRAIHDGKGLYEIHVYDEALGANPFKLIDSPTLGPLEVMTSGEVGANKPMTGDYDLFSICPSWAQYGSRAHKDIIKPGIHLRGRDRVEPGAKFFAGQGMDNVMDPRLHTMGNDGMRDYQKRKEKYQKQLEQYAIRDPQKAKILAQQLGQAGMLGHEDPWAEHGDMGNLTPRILRCINALNVAMGAVGSKAPLRRVHHNAESHRNRMFGAITGDEMVKPKPGEKFGDGFPFTVFQPTCVQQNEFTRRYGDVSTLETLAEFKQYAGHLAKAGYYVPKNWVWGL